MDLLKGDVRAIYRKYFLAAFSIFWTALSLAQPNLYIRIFMWPTAAILAMAPGIVRTYAVPFLLLPLNIFSTYYFQAILKPDAAFFVSVARGLVISGARRGRCRRVKTGPVCIHSCYRG